MHLHTRLYILKNKRYSLFKPNHVENKGESDLNTILLNKLKEISEEEAHILDGDKTIQKSLYASTDEFVIDIKKMLEIGKLIDIRPHTRFIHFPSHKHNYIEIIYMCSGSTTHIINERTVIKLETGDFLFLNQNATQEIMPADHDDVAVNFLVLPAFFDRVFPMLEEENSLKRFLVDALTNEKGLVDYLHFQTHDILPIQNLAENMIWSLTNKQPNNRNITQSTMGLLFLQLLNHTDKMNQNSSDQYEQNLFITCLKYIDENYKTGSLNELSSLVNQPTYYISKLIKKHSDETFKSLLQTKRLNQSVYLLENTQLSVENIITMVGYDNTSYFHRKFKERYGITPKLFRMNAGN